MFKPFITLFTLSAFLIHAPVGFTESIRNLDTISPRSTFKVDSKALGINVANRLVAAVSRASELIKPAGHWPALQVLQGLFNQYQLDLQEVAPLSQGEGYAFVVVSSDISTRPIYMAFTPSGKSLQLNAQVVDQISVGEGELFILSDRPSVLSSLGSLGDGLTEAEKTADNVRIITPSRNIIETVKQFHQDERGFVDYIIPPTVLVNAAGEPIGRIEDGGIVLSLNWRPDRMIQIMNSMLVPSAEFLHFPKTDSTLQVYTMTRYQDALDPYLAGAVLENQILKDTLLELFHRNDFTSFGTL
jgi:hypothetical protein